MDGSAVIGPVIISAEDFDPLMDIFLLAKTVRQSRAEIAAGEGVEHSEAMRRFRKLLRNTIPKAQTSRP